MPSSWPKYVYMYGTHLYRTLFSRTTSTQMFNLLVGWCDYLDLTYQTTKQPRLISINNCIGPFRCPSCLIYLLTDVFYYFTLAWTACSTLEKSIQRSCSWNWALVVTPQTFWQEFPRGFFSLHRWVGHVDCARDKFSYILRILARVSVVLHTTLSRVLVHKTQYIGSICRPWAGWHKPITCYKTHHSQHGNGKVYERWFCVSVYQNTSFEAFFLSAIDGMDIS